MWIFTVPGAPCIYYGDEIGLEGGEDPLCRAGFPWAHRERWDEDVLATYGDRIVEYTTEVGWPPEYVENEHRLEYVPVDEEDADLRMIFSIREDGSVGQIRTGVESAIQNPHFCI